MERDENYVPYTRSKFKLPEEKTATRADYTEIFEETPLYTFFRLFIMQGLYVFSFFFPVLIVKFLKEKFEQWLVDLSRVSGVPPHAYPHIFDISPQSKHVGIPHVSSRD